MVDTVTPLATPAQMNEGAFADLVRSYTPQALTNLMAEATRTCEGTAGRRLAPFTGLTESHRADGIDPDEYADASNLPLDLQGTLGRSYAYALGASSLVRHVWLNEHAVRHPEMWTYSNLSINVVRSYGGSQPVAPTELLTANPDTGHVFFQLGLFIPVGSVLEITYSGGYTTVPADLVRACKYMAAATVLTELDPGVANSGHDPAKLTAAAEKILANYSRS